MIRRNTQLNTEDNSIWPHAYNRPCVIKLTGTLHFERLERCINEIICRHEVLRASFPFKDGIPHQAIRPYRYTELRTIDISHIPAPERNLDIQQLVLSEMRRTFLGAEDVLIRAALLRLCDREHVLIMTVHHIFFDGWSMQNLLKEMSRLYKTFVNAESSSLPDQPFPYTNYALEQRERLSGDRLACDIAYWKRQLSGELPELQLAFDYPRPLQPTWLGKKISFHIPDPVCDGIQFLCHKEKTTLNMLFLTVLNILLHRYTGQEDIIVGSLESGRNRLDLDPMIGLFVNTMVIRTPLQGSMTTIEVLRKVREISMEAYDHETLPFAKLVAEISPTRGSHANPFFQVMLNMHNVQRSNTQVPGLIMEELEVENDAALVDLIMKVTEADGMLKCSFIYSTDVFAADTMKRMSGHFSTLLEGILAAPETPISSLPLLTDEEKRELLAECDRTKADYPREASIHELYEQQVDLYPDRTAFIFENTQMSYQELDSRSNQLANYLEGLGLGPEQLAAVCMERSPEMIVGFLGVLKADAAYVPLDMSYPAERISLMLEDADVSFILTTERIAKQLPPSQAKVVYLDREAKAIAAHFDNRPLKAVGPESLAYVMYTSGSTGRPKGVAVNHRGIVRLVKNITYANVGPEETFLNLTTVAFDVSAFEIYGSLLNGGKLVIMNSHKPPLEQIGETIRNHRVTSICVTPEMLNLLLEDCCHDLGSLRQILSAGDALPVWLARKCLAKLPGCRLINAYGPTENSVYSTSYLVEEILSNAANIPIGRPIANDCVFILDQHLQPVPKGVVGELYVSGDGVARGYLNNDSLTKEKFPANPFSASGGNLYRTGDMVRYRLDGQIEFIGRADHQVKIRGCRIELGEVETIVGFFPGVRQIVAGTHKDMDGTSELVIYVVMQNGESFDPQQMRRFVRGRLPEYMVPTYFMELPEIPMTPVGKIDRKRLPVPAVSSNREKVVFPTNDVEAQLVKIWEKLLHVRPGITDNFFDLGGHSLLAMRMFSEMEKIFQKRLPVSIIFQEDTIEKLAHQLALDNKEKTMSNSLVAIQPHGSKKPLYCIHAIDGEVLSYIRLAHFLGNERPVYGLRFTEEDAEPSIEGLAAKYIEEIRAVQPVGPFRLVGHSLGGIIAYEIARQLHESGQEVSLLGIIDTKNPRRYPHEDTIRNRIVKNLSNFNKLQSDQKVSFIKLKIQNVLERVQNRISPKEVVPAVRDLRNAVSSYRPMPFTGKILLIRATEKMINDELFVDKKLGWEGMAGGGITVHEVPGNHFTLMKEPNVEHVAKYIGDYLVISEKDVRTDDHGEREAASVCGGVET